MLSRSTYAGGCTHSLDDARRARAARRGARRGAARRGARYLVGARELRLMARRKVARALRAEAQRLPERERQQHLEAELWQQLPRREGHLLPEGRVEIR